MGKKRKKKTQEQWMGKNRGRKNENHLKKPDQKYKEGEKCLPAREGEILPGGICREE